MDATQIILIVFIVLLIIIYPIIISARNKKENQKLQEQTNSLKCGDKILTTTGVYGTIVDLHLDDNKKIVTIETGTGKNKGYMAIDAYSIYTVLTEEKPAEENKPQAIKPQEEKAQENVSMNVKPQEQVKENKVADTIAENEVKSETVDEKTQETKKGSKRKKAN